MMGVVVNTLDNAFFNHLLNKRYINKVDDK